MQNKEMSNYEVLKEGYDQDLEALRQKIEQEVRDHHAKGIRYGHEAEALAQWKLNKMPYTAWEKEKAVNDHNAAQRRKEALIQEEIEVQLKVKQPILEKIIFGVGGMDAVKAREDREAQIQAFKSCMRKREAHEQKIIEQKREAAKSAKIAMDKQKKTLSQEQDNHAYRPKGDEQVKGQFSDKATQVKTNSTTFNAQNEKTRNERAFQDLQAKEKVKQAQREKAIAFKKAQMKKSKAHIAKQNHSRVTEQDNEKLSPAHSHGAFNEAGQGDKETQHKSVDDFKSRMRQRTKERSHKHDRSKDHTH